MLNGRQPAGDPVSLQEYRDQMAGQENSYADQSYDIEAEDTGEMIPQEYDPAQYGEETYTYEDLPAAAGPEYPEAQMQPEAAAAPSRITTLCRRSLPQRYRSPYRKAQKI